MWFRQLGVGACTYVCAGADIIRYITEVLEPRFDPGWRDGVMHDKMKEFHVPEFIGKILLSHQR